ncbi:Dolichyl-phosphate-mannose-protein mannosyltransferase [Paenibacillus algorifonticola]|uniref:Dolichyl-phosphate-mannose-protein mannosyltransferase n=1 Tax=Paenibacillus algorifonticola TaxID=684063 RepID=A0A1I2A2A6_9BACL|nr:glycosyltransferase family 39 protein [Paenibacillus algorifonticola]SFE38244.1 Dolichyl-phosphate-mannose-protein mannosyltransferase [Paenibacillus algorifonticola]
MAAIKKQRVDAIWILCILVSALLNGFLIWTDDHVNTYYTTTVASMLQSFHNFFFATVDSGGFVTVDKPPVTFWVQTAFAYVFGLHGWSVILPQALSGIGSTILLYVLFKPTFGLTAARIGAAAMATMPVAVAVSRTNNIDSMLVFTLLLAVWLLFRGTKQGKAMWLIGAFAVIGVGFNMKMMEAYMVLPAFYLFALMAWKGKWFKKISLLAGATAIMLIISLSWAVTVDSISTDNRPYVGSSQTNSVLELAFGYNGLSRLTGNRGGGTSSMMGPQELPAVVNMAFAQTNVVNSWFSGDVPGGNRSVASIEQDGQGAGDDAGSRRWANSQGADSDSNNGGRAENFGNGRNGTDGGAGGLSGGAGGGAGAGGFNGGPGGGVSGGMFGTGTAGPLRLFQAELSGQASWFLPFVFVACVGMLASIRRRNVTLKHKEVLFWLAWLVPVMGFFSVAGFFHQYYLIIMGAPIAALLGAGWSELWSQYRSKAGWLGWLLPLGIAATAVFEWYIMHPFDAAISSGWSLAVLVGGLAASMLLVVLRLTKQKQSKSLIQHSGGGTEGYEAGANVGVQSGEHAASRRKIWQQPAVNLIALLGLLVLFIGPAYWATTPIVYGQSSQLPEAGPDQTNASSRDEPLNEEALAFLKAHRTGEKYLFATNSYSTAAPYIIDSGENVIILGGYSGSDPVLSVDRLKALVAAGELKYFLVSQGGRGGGINNELTQWITSYGKQVPSSEWQSTGGSGNAADSGGTASDAASNSSSRGFGGGSSNITIYEVTPEAALLSDDL